MVDQQAECSVLTENMYRRSRVNVRCRVNGLLLSRWDGRNVYVHIGYNNIGTKRKQEPQHAHVIEDQSQVRMRYTEE